MKTVARPRMRVLRTPSPPLRRIANNYVGTRSIPYVPTKTEQIRGVTNCLCSRGIHADLRTNPQVCKSQMPLLQDWSRNAVSPGSCRSPHTPSGSPALLCGGPLLPSGMWHRHGYCRPDGSNLESFDVFQSVNDPSADLQIDRACLGPSPSFKSTGRDPPAEREFCLAEVGKIRIFSSVAWDRDTHLGDHEACRERNCALPAHPLVIVDRVRPYGQRNLMLASWVLDGFAVVPTAALDQPHSMACPAVPALPLSGC